jgi:hypothetical protein
MTDWLEAKMSADWLEPKMSREDAARFQYRIRPYLSGAPRPALDARLSDIAVNLFDFMSDGRIGLWDNTACDQWLNRLIAVNVEFARREEHQLKLSQLQEWVFTEKTMRSFQEQPHVFRTPSPNGVFCKYGEERWMREFHERGAVKITPASCYSAHTLDPARRDDEMSLTCFVGPHDYDLGMVHESILRIRADRCWLEIEHAKPADHYLYCFSVNYRIRLFADFHANACVVIHDQDEFIRRLIPAVRKALPGWHVELGKAKYIDPYCVLQLLPNSGAEMFFFKHIRFMYQHEWRLVALPPPNCDGPEGPLYLKLGDLRDISQLIVLKGDPFARRAEEPSSDAKK